MKRYIIPKLVNPKQSLEDYVNLPFDLDNFSVLKKIVQWAQELLEDTANGYEYYWDDVYTANARCTSNFIEFDVFYDSGNQRDKFRASFVVDETYRLSSFKEVQELIEYKVEKFVYPYM